MPQHEARQTVALTGRSLSGAATTQSPAVDVTGAIDWVAVNVNVTAIAGTSPSLTLTLQWSQDGGTTWATPETADSFAAITATKNTVNRFQKKGNHFRFNEAFTGTTPSATYTANVVYR